MYVAILVVCRVLSAIVVGATSNEGFLVPDCFSFAVFVCFVHLALKSLTEWWKTVISPAYTITLFHVCLNKI